MKRPRRKPYTARGISRVPCVRCGEPAMFQWQACADGRQYRPLCLHCDFLLNKKLLQFMRLPWKRASQRYWATIKHYADMVDESE